MTAPGPDFNLMAASFTVINVSFKVVIGFASC